jgi:hypothetical protein
MICQAHIAVGWQIAVGNLEQVDSEFIEVDAFNTDFLFLAAGCQNVTADE